MRVLLALVLAAMAAAQSFEYRYLTEGVLEERLRLAHPQNSERYKRLKTLFEVSGCLGDHLRQKAVKGSKEPNIICGVPGTGESPRKIVVGAHFDTSGGEGVIDNWSGAVLLPSLSQLLRRTPPRHAFEFVGFAAEEKGLLGSRAYLKSIPKQERRRIAAVITMDCIGLTPELLTYPAREMSGSGERGSRQESGSGPWPRKSRPCLRPLVDGEAHREASSWKGSGRLGEHLA
jgi:hypothetical protein